MLNINFYFPRLKYQRKHENYFCNFYLKYELIQYINKNVFQMLLNTLVSDGMYAMKKNKNTF